MGFNLTGKKAVATGGVRGIGLATVEALAKAGANVIFTARNQPSIAKAQHGRDWSVDLTVLGGRSGIRVVASLVCRHTLVNACPYRGRQHEAQDHGG